MLRKMGLRSNQQIHSGLMTSTAWLLLPDIHRADGVDLGTYCSSAPNTDQTGHLQFTA